MFLGSCIPDYQGNYLIKIKESVYEGAFARVGGYRMHIMHEIAHAFLCLLGFTPILDRQFKNNSLKPFESMEWQAKALAGEVLMEFNLTKGKNVEEIENKCIVSIDGARMRQKY